MKRRVKLWEVALYPLLGVLMFATKMAMELLPNIHLLGLLIVVYTLTFRTRALFPIYIYVFLDGLLAGFATWWIPYLYVWTVLWGAVMLLPKNLPKKFAVPLYAAVCSLHGLAFGTLYAPVQALIFGLDWRGTLAWIAAGLPFDLIHAVSNLIAGMAALPLADALKKAVCRFDKNK